MTDAQGYIEILRELEFITMKRNTAMTIIESSDLTKTLVSIKRQISAIKHQSKRSQLMRILSELEKKVASLKIKTGIICTGQKVNGEIYFKYIDPPTSSQFSSTYCYDDIFNVYQISIILFDIKHASQKEITSLIKLVESDLNQPQSNKIYDQTDYSKYNEYDGQKYYMNESIEKNIDKISVIYHITKSSKYRSIPLSWLTITAATISDKEQKKDVKLIVDYEFENTNPLSVCCGVGI